MARPLEKTEPFPTCTEAINSGVPHFNVPITTKSSLRWLSVYSLHFLVCMNMLLTSADIAYCSLGESQPEANERASSLDSSADSVKAVSWLRLRGWLCYKRSFRTTHRALSTKSREASMNLAKAMLLFARDLTGRQGSILGLSDPTKPHTGALRTRIASETQLASHCVVTLPLRLS